MATSTLRRRFIQTAAAMLPTSLTAAMLLPASAQALAPLHPTLPDRADNELIILCAECVHLEAAQSGLYWSEDEVDPRYATPEQQAAFLVFDAARERQHVVLNSIADRPARTPDGLRAKARAIIAFYDPDPPETGCIAGAALWSLIRDVAGSLAA